MIGISINNTPLYIAEAVTTPPSANTTNRA
jgi:hypothetical protein